MLDEIQEESSDKEDNPIRPGSVISPNLRKNLGKLIADHPAEEYPRPVEEKAKIEEEKTG